MTEGVDEAVLLRDISLGGRRSRRALEELYRYYAGRFLAFYRRRGVSEFDREELCQDAFVKIVRSCRDAEDIHAPRAWLWSVARSVMLDYFRRRGDEALPLWQEEGDVDWEETLNLQDCVDKQFARFAARAPEAAQAISWAVVEGFTAVEIAAMLERSPGATREYLSRVRKKLRQALAVCRDYLTQQ